MRLRRSVPLLAIAVWVSLLTGCSEQESGESASASSPAQTAESTPHHESGHPHFDYSVDGEHGPSRWGDVPSWKRCGTGKAQSPIDVPAGSGSVLTDTLAINYESGPVGILNNSHTINVQPQGANTVESEGKSYRLSQMHLHADSEHEVDGTATPLEAHFVHGLVGADGEFVMTTDADTGEKIFQEFLVLGVFLARGTEDNPDWAAVLDEEVLPRHAAEGGHYATVNGLTMDPTALLPEDLTAYSYSGSLTTPTPTCVEGVNWFVLTTPVEVSSRQIEAFTSIYPNNSRPVQDR